MINYKDMQWHTEIIQRHAMKREVQKRSIFLCRTNSKFLNFSAVTKSKTFVGIK